MIHPHRYFFQNIAALDSSISHTMSAYDALTHYITLLETEMPIESSIISLSLLSDKTSSHHMIHAPLSKVLNLEYLTSLIEGDEHDVKFVLSFSHDSDYSSHVKIVGQLQPTFMYQILLDVLNEFERECLYTVRLQLATYWQLSNKGTHPWVMIINS